jgi:hypothetical protein
MAQKTAWTVLVFMAGDNNLSTAGDCDLEEMRRVGSSEHVNLLVEFDNAGDAGTRRIYVGKNGVNETIQTLGETDSGSPEVLSSFISWAAENYPADRYALILWNHGGGWAPTEVDRIARSVDSPGYNEREITERSSSSLGRVFFRSSLEQVFGLAGANERAICSDDGSGHSLDTIELGKVIAQGAETIGQAFDLLGMDACLMSNLEVAYQLRNHVRYVVASEETEPGDGWPYERILGRLISNPGILAEEIAQHIVTDYISSYIERDHSGNVTQTALNLDRISAITGPLDDFAGQLATAMPTMFPKVWQAQRRSARFAQNTLWDLGQFCQVLEQYSPDTGVGKAAQAVWSVLEPGVGNFVLAESHRGNKVQHCRGVSIYLVPPITKISRYYNELDFAQSHNWAGMLEAYHRV